MNFLVQASTDIGISKSTNQDSLCVKVIKYGDKKAVFACICDGMGGLSKGEVASATVIEAFSHWVESELSALCQNGQIEDYIIRQQWEKIITAQNSRIMNYGRSQGVKLGTTVCAILLTESRYYILNVGDTRAYEIYDRVSQLTHDQTVVQREIDSGILTSEQAKTDPRRSVLLQCVGASSIVYPDMYFGDTKYHAVYMICSDGFRHQITEEEIYNSFSPAALLDVDTMKKNSEYLIELNKSRNENDNISVLLVRTF